MSEFVECQNCGRRFFAENLDCPYCSDEQELEDLMDEVQGRTRVRSSMFSILFASFRIVLVGIMLFSLVGLGRAPKLATQMILVSELVLAGFLWVGVSRRRRWGRPLGVMFILGNAVLGILSLTQRGHVNSLLWGPGPLVLLVFLIPFLSSRSRDFFTR